MKQPGLKTVQEMFEKTIEFIFKESQFKTFGTSRTDSKVSALEMGVYLNINTDIELTEFIHIMNKNFPNDIRALSIEKVDEGFNPLEKKELKHYVYLFSSGAKPHPFSASIIHSEFKKLDIALMQRGATLFCGEHDFVKYTAKATKTTQTIRTIIDCHIAENTEFKANFFPKKTYALHIKSNGFMRYQVRLIMGQLLALGKNEMSLEEIQDSLNPIDNIPMRHIAQGSGLILKSSF